MLCLHLKLVTCLFEMTENSLQRHKRLEAVLTGAGERGILKGIEPRGNEGPVFKDDLSWLHAPLGDQATTFGPFKGPYRH